MGARAHASAKLIWDQWGIYCRTAIMFPVKSRNILANLGNDLWFWRPSSFKNTSVKHTDSPKGDLYSYILKWQHNYLQLWYPYIYIYIRQGEEVPREDINQDHWIGEKTVFHCGKMEIFHVVLLHPTSSRKLHERYYTPPHRSPPLPPAWLMHDKYKRTYTSVAWRMRDKYKITYTSVAWRRRHNYKRTYTSVTWHMPEKYITWL